MILVWSVSWTGRAQVSMAAPPTEPLAVQASDRAAPVRKHAFPEPRVAVRPAAKLEYSTTVDCNSPSFWDGDVYYVFNSHEAPYRARGQDLFHLEKLENCTFDSTVNGGRWIEAVIKVPNGPLYGWYHFEPKGLCPGKGLTAAEIGAARSEDNGLTWKDLGIVLAPAKDSLRCKSKNGTVAGGHGDYCVVLDREEQNLYIYYSNYSAPLAEQGVNVARMAWRDRDAPVGKVKKWYRGEYQEPGLGGRMSPLLPGKVDYIEHDPDSFWGPSIHWNTYLDCYVMLLNHGQGHNYRQEGIYICYNRDPARPDHWTTPKKILEGTPYEEHVGRGHSRELSAKEKIYIRKWYPAVQGLPEIHGTDKLAGQTARLFLNASSEYEIEFTKQAE